MLKISVRPKPYSPPTQERQHLPFNLTPLQRRTSCVSVHRRHVLVCRAAWWPFQTKTMSNQSLSLADRIAITTKEYDGYKRSFPEARADRSAKFLCLVALSKSTHKKLFGSTTVGSRLLEALMHLRSSRLLSRRADYVSTQLVPQFHCQI